MVNADTIATDSRTMTSFSSNGRRGQLVTFRGGRTEIYREYSDNPGMMEFLGYYDDICHTHPRVCEVVHPYLQAHLAAHRDHWTNYLPGAQVWLRVA